MELDIIMINCPLAIDKMATWANDRLITNYITRCVLVTSK